MNQLSTEDRSRIIACLVEGTSQRAIVRITGSAKKTVARLAVELGEACESFSRKVMVELPKMNMWNPRGRGARSLSQPACDHDKWCRKLCGQIWRSHTNVTM